MSDTVMVALVSAGAPALIAITALITGPGRIHRTRGEKSEVRTTQRTHKEQTASQEEDFFLMSNLSQKHTGLPFVVWISVRGGARHDVRVKVSRNLNATARELVSVAIRPDVRVVAGGHMSAADLALLRRWVRLNEDVILRYWNSEIDTLDALEAIRAI